MVSNHSLVIAAGIAMALCARAPCADAQFLRGDADESGRLGIGDAIRIFQFLFQGEGLAIRCLDAADADDDGHIAVTDGIVCLAYLFQRGNPLAAPFPHCGPDPTADELACASFAGCSPGFTYFGVELEGDGIIFLVDRSPPQSDNGILQKAKAEIQRILSELPGSGQFALGFFDKGLLKFPAGDSLAVASDEMKDSASSFIQGVFGGSGTCSKAAFLEMVRLARGSTARNPIIVYVGDGGGTCPGGDSEQAYLEQLVSEVTEQNDGAARIHVIAANPCRLCATILQKLVDQNGGTYTEVEP